MILYNRSQLICTYHFDGLVQDCSNCIANTLELLQSLIKPSIYHSYKVSKTDRFIYWFEVCLAIQWNNVYLLLFWFPRKSGTRIKIQNCLTRKFIPKQDLKGVLQFVLGSVSQTFFQLQFKFEGNFTVDSKQCDRCKSFQYNRTTLVSWHKKNFVAMEKSFMKWSPGLNVLTHWGQDKMADFRWRHFQTYFLEWKHMSFY